MDSMQTLRASARSLVLTLLWVCAHATPPTPAPAPAPEDVTLEATCSVRKLRCPVSPSHGDDYAILGNEDRTGPCAMQTDDDGNRFFEFVVGEPGECNATITTDETDGSETYVASLVYVPAEAGELLFEEFPTFVCSCKVHMAGNAEVGMHQEETEDVHVGGESDAFVPTAMAYGSSDFDQPLTTMDDGSALVTSDKFYIMVSSDGDPINVTKCVASPADMQYRDITQAKIWDACDLNGMFQPELYPTDDSSQTKLSMRAFQYMGYGTGVMITCETIRCGEAPCLTCDDGLIRRLQSEEDTEDTGTASVQLSVSAASNPIMLPGPLDTTEFTAVHSASGTESPAFSGSVVFYNSPLLSDEGFPASLAKAVKAWLGFDDVEVIVTEVSLASEDFRLRRVRRRLQDEDEEEVTVLVKFQVVLTSEDDLADVQAAYTLGSEQALADAWREELLATWGLEAPSLIADKVTDEDFSPPVADAEVDTTTEREQVADTVQTEAPTIAPVQPATTNSDAPVYTVTLEQLVMAVVVFNGVLLVCCGFFLGWKFGKGRIAASSLQSTALSTPRSRYHETQYDAFSGVAPPQI